MPATNSLNKTKNKVKGPKLNATFHWKLFTISSCKQIKNDSEVESNNRFNLKINVL